MVQREDDLHQPRRACGCLGVTQLALDRAERTPLIVRASSLKNKVQALELRGIARLGARTVAFDEVHRGRGVARALVAAPQRFGLAFADRRVDALRATIRAGAHAANHRVHLVPVPLSVLQPLERHHAQTLAQQRAVGLIGERTAVARRRQRRRLGEAHVHEDVVQRVTTTGDGHVGMTKLKLVDRRLHRGERARTRRVGDAIGAARVQAVRDATRDDVAQEPGEAGFLPRNIVTRDAVTGLLHLLLLQPREPQRALPYRTLQARNQRGQQLLRAGHSEDHRSARQIQLPRAKPRHIVQHHLRDDQGDQLAGVRCGQGAGRNAEPHRIEGDIGQERPATSVGLVRGFGVGIVIVLNQPMRLRNVGDEIPPFERVAPERWDVERSGHDATETDNSDRREGGHPNAPSR